MIGVGRLDDIAEAALLRADAAPAPRLEPVGRPAIERVFAHTSRLFGKVIAVGWDHRALGRMAPAGSRFVDEDEVDEDEVGDDA